MKMPTPGMNANM